MSLKISGQWKVILKWAIISLLGVLLLIFFVRVVTWEDAYYREKEGSERAIANSTSVEGELVEVEPSVQEKREYTVAADRPRYLNIEKLNISQARILPVGINSEGELGTPNNIFDVGWYESSGTPGSGKTILIDGHNGGPHVHGIFKELPTLGADDIIMIERGDSKEFRYRVVENIEVPLAESDIYMSTAMTSPEPGRESVTLISCTGEWSQQQGTYLSRQFTRAISVDE